MTLVRLCVLATLVAGTTALAAPRITMDFTNGGPVGGPDPWRARLDLAERLNEERSPAP